MQNDPTQNSSQRNAINHPAHQEAAVENNKYSDQAGKDKDDKNTGLPKKDDEEIVEDESRPEDYKKFNVDKVDELEKVKKESQDKE